ncbi:TPA: hypothetical protein DEG21_04905 [Patescibacteria group bacterium]|nr:hypothetical protein [Candidatus Gracilibacteria bacterium]HBY75169.1 hypothetical protein [Candidatus Gracilibacteria bacterium]
MATVYHDELFSFFELNSQLNINYKLAIKVFTINHAESVTIKPIIPNIIASFHFCLLSEVGSASLKAPTIIISIEIVAEAIIIALVTDVIVFGI